MNNCLVMGHTLPMLSAIERARLQLQICPHKLVLLAQHTSGRRFLQSVDELNNDEQCELLRVLMIMYEHGRPVAYRCAAAG